MDLVAVRDGKRKRGLVKLAYNNNVNSKSKENIIQVLLSNLPLEDLFPNQLVCKAWHKMILEYAVTGKFGANSFYISMVDNRHPVLERPRLSSFPKVSGIYSIDFDTKYADGMRFLARYKLPRDWYNFFPVNSCNGLFCIKKLHASRDSDRSCSCSCGMLNPMTSEFMELPVSALSVDPFYYYDYGLGFSLKTKKYKVIKIGFPSASANDKKTTVEICTVGYDSEWRSIKSIPYSFNDERPGVYLDGALHWNAEENENTKIICRFDVESERFEAIPLPSIDLIKSYKVGIGAFNGHLYATLCDSSSHFYEWEIWKMQKHEGVNDSWIKEFVLKYELLNDGSPWPKELQIIKVCEDGEILFLITPSYVLSSYNPKNGKVKILDNDKCLGWLWVQEIEHPDVNSLKKILAGDDHQI